MGGALLFYGVQVLCPVLGCFLAYLIAYYRRLKGASGRELEAGLGLHGASLAAGLSFFFFWGWPSSARPFYDQPGLSGLMHLLLSNPPSNDPNLMPIKLFTGLVFAGTSGILARLAAGPLNRRLVRSVPRFFAGFQAFRRR